MFRCWRPKPGLKTGCGNKRYYWTVFFAHFYFQSAQNSPSEALKHPERTDMYCFTFSGKKMSYLEKRPAVFFSVKETSIMQLQDF